MKTYNANKKKIESLDMKCKPIILLGDDSYLKRHFIKQLVSDLEKGTKLEQFNFDLSEIDFDMFRNLINVQSLISNKKVIVLSGDQKSLTKTFTVKKPKSKKFTYEELILDTIANAKQDVHLIMDFSALDKRKKIYKEISSNGLLLEMQPLKEKETIQFVSDYISDNECSMSLETIKYFLSIVDHDLNFIVSELNKLCSYEDKITKETVDLLTSKSSKVVVFDLIDLISKGDTKNAIILLDGMLSQGGSPFQLITLLSMHYERLLYAKIMPETKDNDFIKIMKVHPMLVKKYKEQSSKLTLSKIERAIKLIVDVEVSLKSGYNELVYVTLMISSLCRGVGGSARKPNRSRK